MQNPRKRKTECEIPERGIGWWTETIGGRRRLHRMQNPRKRKKAAAPSLALGGITKLQNVAYGAAGYLAHGAISERVEGFPAIAQHGQIAISAASLGSTYLLFKVIYPISVEYAMFGAGVNVVLKLLRQ